MEAVNLSLMQPLRNEEHEVPNLNLSLNSHPPSSTCLQLLGRVLIRVVSHPVTAFGAMSTLTYSLCAGHYVPWAVSAVGLTALSITSTCLVAGSDANRYQRFINNSSAGAIGAIMGFALFYVARENLWIAAPLK